MPCPCLQDAGASIGFRGAGAGGKPFVRPRRARAQDPLASGVGQSDPAARAHRADLGRPCGRRPARRRPDRAHDAHDRALGARARADHVGGARHAAPRSRDPASALAVRRRHGRARLHGLQRPVLRRRAFDGRAQHVDHSGRDPRARPDRRPPRFRGAHNRDAGAGHAGDHDRRRRDRRARRMVASCDVRVQPGRLADAARLRLLRLLHVGPARRVPMSPGSAFSPRWPSRRW